MIAKQPTVHTHFHRVWYIRALHWLLLHLEFQSIDTWAKLLHSWRLYWFSHCWQWPLPAAMVDLQSVLINHQSLGTRLGHPGSLSILNLLSKQVSMLLYIYVACMQWPCMGCMYCCDYGLAIASPYVVMAWKQDGGSNQCISVFTAISSPGNKC